MSRKTMRPVILGSILLFAFSGCGDSETNSGAALSPGTAVNNSQQHADQVQNQNTSRQWREAFEKSLGSDDSADRYHALILLNNTQIDSATRLASLVDALKQEVQVPSKGNLPVEGASLPPDEFIKLRLTRKLATSASQAELAEITRLQTGEVRERAVLAQGFAGRREAIPQLEKLLEQSTSGWVRSHAAFLLGELGAETSAPLLKKALDDPFSIEKKRYVRTYNEYPVRIKAYSALQKIGVKVDKEPVLFQPAEP